MDILGYIAGGVLVTCGLHIAWAARGEWIVAGWLVVVAVVIALAVAKASAGDVTVSWSNTWRDANGNPYGPQDIYDVRIVRLSASGAQTTVDYAPPDVDHVRVIQTAGTTGRYQACYRLLDKSAGPWTPVTNFYLPLPAAPVALAVEAVTNGTNQ